MRVITGDARGRKLKAPEGIDVRPTKDGVKEAMFSAIQFEITGAVVLDLFAGSGQLGIEALSRGAKRAVFVDSSRESIDFVVENLETVGYSDMARVVNMPNNAFLRGCTDTFDIAFLDPPYSKNLIQKSLPALTELMSESGIIVCEHEYGCRLPETVNGFYKAREKKHGITGLTIYRRIDNETAENEE